VYKIVINSTYVSNCLPLKNGGIIQKEFLRTWIGLRRPSVPKESPKMSVKPERGPTGPKCPIQVWKPGIEEMPMKMATS
jgi:hypothetical protein